MDLASLSPVPYNYICGFHFTTFVDICDIFWLVFYFNCFFVPNKSYCIVFCFISTPLKMSLFDLTSFHKQPEHYWPEASNLCLWPEIISCLRNIHYDNYKNWIFNTQPHSTVLLFPYYAKTTVKQHTRLAIRYSSLVGFIFCHCFLVVVPFFILGDLGYKVENTLTGLHQDTNQLFIYPFLHPPHLTSIQLNWIIMNVFVFTFRFNTYA